MPKGYRELHDLTSDVMFEATGRDLKELFSNAAKALFSVICDIRNVKGKTKKTVKATGNDLRETLIAYLQELIALVDTEEMFFSRFVIKKISEKEVIAEAYGEAAKPSLAGTVVKAVTYYNFDVKKTTKGFRCQVVVDV